MKIELIKDKLQKAINQVERSVGKNLSLPILSNIVFENKGKKLLIKATNLEIGVEVEIPANIEDDFSFALTPTIITNILQYLPTNDKVELVFEGDLVIITTNKGVVTLKTQKTEDFPIIPRVNGQGFSITTGMLVEGIKSVAYAAAISDIKPEIASVYIYYQNSTLYFVSTDGFRLSEKNFSLNQPLHTSFNIIIPLKNALEINHILNDYEPTQELNIITDANQLSLILNEIYITSRIIDGVYPDYRQIMPKTCATTMMVNKQDLTNILKLIGVLADKFNKLLIEVDDKGITFTIKNTDIGEGVLTMAHKEFSGPAVTTIISGRYLLDVIQSIEGDMIIIGFNESNKPLYITGVNTTTFQGLVMPLRS